MKYLFESYGEVFKLSRRNAIMFLGEVIDGKDPVLSDFGISLGLIEARVTDIDKDEAVYIMRKLQ